MILLLKEIAVKVLRPVGVILLRLNVGISPLLSPGVIPKLWQVAVVVVREAGVALLKDLVLEFLGDRADAVEVWKGGYITATVTKDC
jgi:hypothetical protein